MTVFAHADLFSADSCCARLGGALSMCPLVSIPAGDAALA